MKISFWLSIGPSGDRYLTTGHQVAVWAKLPTVNWMVCLPSSQTLKHTQQHSIKNGRTSYETRRGKHKGVKEKASELKVPACHDLLSTSPISPAPCAQGALPVMGWQKGARCRSMHRCPATTCKETIKALESLPGHFSRRAVKGAIPLGRTLSSASGDLLCLEAIMAGYVVIHQFTTWRQTLG